MRIAVIGARRRRNGIGVHLARFLVLAGADVAAVLGTTRETAAEAAETLERATGHRPRACVDVEALLATEGLEGVVIASPHATHAGFLELCLARRLHAFCDKPVTWGGADPAAEALALGARFLDAGLHLVVNTQWPETLPTYDELHPDARMAPEAFWMRMSPPSRPEDAMLVDAMPHPLSLLHATVGPGEIRDVAFSSAVPGAGIRPALRTTFAYVARHDTVACEVDLVETAEQPRSAGYGFDGRPVHREIELPAYDLFFRSDDGRRVPLPDPTPLRVRLFLDAVASGPPTTIDPAVDPGMVQLARIHDAFTARR